MIATPNKIFSIQKFKTTWWNRYNVNTKDNIDSDGCKIDQLLNTEKVKTNK